VSIGVAMSPQSGLAGMAYMSLFILQPLHGVIMGRKRRKLENSAR
jgi:hypothetical protein